MDGCPSSERLSGYLAGTCSPDEFAEVESHLEHCQTCAQMCLSAPDDDALLVRIRQAMDSRGSDRSPGAVTESPRRLPTDRAHRFEPEGIAADQPPPEIEGFRIIRELGRGGMGAVYLAWQESTKRQVALKVLLNDRFASPTARRRFEREVELAAQLEHPNIVTILESGLARGHHYFAMQFVEGERLDTYASRHARSLGDTIALFSRVCRAVSHAHQRGVLHRDLKPSNIIVDASGTPHVLDFGLARELTLTEEGEAAPTLISMPGELMGTLPFMSPEQTTGRHHDVDVRSDVYALGVILYRLLTGKHPYRVSGEVRDVLRNIVETPPVRPRTLRRELRGDLETILLTSLHKDRARRYQSADALARDLENYLRGAPIDARRESAVYVLRKTVALHRVPLTIMAIVCLLTGWAGLASWRQTQAARSAAVREILTALVQDPIAAQRELESADEPVRRQAAGAVGLAAASPAYTDRIVGARGAPLLDPAAFWSSVDGGPLWHNGEWLELALLPAEAATPLLDQLSTKARNGSEREKYIAFCLIGQLAVVRDDLLRTCVEAAALEQTPGVVAAARWAASRLGRDVNTPDSRDVFNDSLSRLTFVRLPAVAGFTPGSSPGDPDRYADEVRIEPGVAIAPIYLSQSEVTWAALAGFLEQPAATEIFPPDARSAMALYIAKLPPGDLPQAAAGFLTLETLRAFAAWLSERGAHAVPARRYRLPTEHEWEYAARAGGHARFCFGDDARYTRFFANSEGAMPFWHITARKMPNWFGLFDMHGGLWEWTDTRYPPEMLADEALREFELWVYKGGAFYSPAVRCRAAQRNYGSSNRASDYNGGRIVMEVIEP